MNWCIALDYIAGFQVGLDVRFDDRIVIASFGVLMIGVMWGPELRVPPWEEFY
jgi:hypothetical protein